MLARILRPHHTTLYSYEALHEVDRRAIGRGLEVEGQRLPSSKTWRTTVECSETEINFAILVLKLWQLYVCVWQLMSDIQLNEKVFSMILDLMQLESSFVRTDTKPCTERAHTYRKHQHGFPPEQEQQFQFFRFSTQRKTVSFLRTCLTLTGEEAESVRARSIGCVGTLLRSELSSRMTVPWFKTSCQNDVITTVPSNIFQENEKPGVQLWRQQYGVLSCKISRRSNMASLFFSSQELIGITNITCGAVIVPVSSSSSSSKKCRRVQVLSLSKF